MSDDADTAAALQAQANKSAAAYRRPVPSIKPVGWCHSCGENLGDARLFCDSACADDYERMERQR